MLNIEITVRCGNELSDVFETDTGAPQGDFSSSSEFTFYLAKTLEKDYDQRLQAGDHDYIHLSRPIISDHNTEHNYNKIA